MAVSGSSSLLAGHHAIGIDIADGSLELVNLIEHGDGGISLDEHARVVLDNDAIVHGCINNRRQLEHAFQNLVASAATIERGSWVVTALPDAQVVVKTVPLGENITVTATTSLKGLARNIFHELELPIEHPLLQWHVVGGRAGTSLIIYATSEPHVKQWSTFFKRFGLRLVVAEMESLAIARALVRRCGHRERIAIVDFGMRQTNLSLLDQAGLRYSHSFEQDSLILRQLLRERFDLTDQEVSKRLRMVNLASDTDDIANRIREHLSGLFGSVLAALERHELQPTRFLVTGIDSRIRGIVALARKLTSRPASRGSLWIRPSTRQGAGVRTLPFDTFDQQLYAGAVGLALRGLNRVTLAKGINFVNAR